MVRVISTHQLGGYLCPSETADGVVYDDVKLSSKKTRKTLASVRKQKLPLTRRGKRFEALPVLRTKCLVVGKSLLQRRSDV